MQTVITRSEKKGSPRTIELKTLPPSPSPSRHELARLYLDLPFISLNLPDCIQLEQRTQSHETFVGTQNPVYTSFNYMHMLTAESQFKNRPNPRRWLTKNDKILEDDLPGMAKSRKITEIGQIPAYDKPESLKRICWNQQPPSSHLRLQGTSDSSLPLSEIDVNFLIDFFGTEKRR